jgi:hypothetical protein
MSQEVDTQSKALFPVYVHWREPSRCHGAYGDHCFQGLSMRNI